MILPTSRPCGLSSMQSASSHRPPKPFYSLQQRLRPPLQRHEHLQRHQHYFAMCSRRPLLLPRLPNRRWWVQPGPIDAELPYRPTTTGAWRHPQPELPADRRADAVEVPLVPALASVPAVAVAAPPADSDSYQTSPSQSGGGPTGSSARRSAWWDRPAGPPPSSPLASNCYWRRPLPSAALSVSRPEWRQHGRR